MCNGDELNQNEKVNNFQGPSRRYIVENELRLEKMTVFEGCIPLFRQTKNETLFVPHYTFNI